MRGSLRAGSRTVARICTAAPAPAELRPAAEVAEVGDAAASPARHGTGEVHDVVIDHGRVLDVDAHALDLAHADLEGLKALPTVVRLAVAIPIAILEQHPVDVLLLDLLRVERLEGVVLAVVREPGEPAVLLETDLLHDPAVDEADALATEQADVVRGPDRELRHGLEGVFAVGVEVLIERGAAEHTAELVVQDAGLRLADRVTGGRLQTVLDDALGAIAVDPAAAELRHNLHDLPCTCLLHDSISLTFWYAVLRPPEPFGRSQTVHLRQSFCSKKRKDQPLTNRVNIHRLYQNVKRD